MYPGILRDGAIVAFSGGIDSTTVLAEAIDRYTSKNVVAVSFDYGQKHKIELDQAQLIAKHYHVTHVIVDLPRIFSGAGSTLIDDDAEVETMGSYDELNKRYGAQPTVVPNRNMNIIANCVTVSLTYGLNRVMLGVHGTDSENYHYPDCTPMFIGAMSAAVEIGNSGNVRLEAPFNTWSKTEIIRRAAELDVPAELTQSCYRGERPQCGQCATCHERIIAFGEAKFVDPVEYASSVVWPDDAVQWRDRNKQ